MTRNDPPATPMTGVGGARLLHSDEQSVACWYSETQPAQSSAQADVLAFHGVVNAFFQRGAVVPFRFPTTLPDAAALQTWLAANASEVTRELERLGPMVQMEIHLANPAARASGSGREYLESRRDAERSLADRARLARDAVADLAAEWRQRETRDGLRCYALVPRGREQEFVARIGALAGGATSRVTGPWPPAEFLNAALTRPS